MITDDTDVALLAMAPATMDRRLAPDRAKLLVRGRSRTKPGSLLKEWIPIWTCAEWNDAVPGFVELDLVGHEGGDRATAFTHRLVNGPSGSRSERRFVGVDAPTVGGRVGAIPPGSVRVSGSAVIIVVLMGARGAGRGDDVPHALDAAADGGDQDFQLEGVGEWSAELGVAPVRAKSLVIDVARHVLGGAVGYGYGRRVGGAEEFAGQGEGAWWVGVPVAGRAGPDLGVTGSAGARPGGVVL